MFRYPVQIDFVSNTIWYDSIVTFRGYRNTFPLTTSPGSEIDAIKIKYIG